MKTEILAIKGSWYEVVDDCRSTVGKESLGHEPSSDFKRRILISEHSPIRNIHIKWCWKCIPTGAVTSGSAILRHSAQTEQALTATNFRRIRL